MPVLAKGRLRRPARGELALLTVRFGIAAVLLWAIVAWRRDHVRLHWRLMRAAAWRSAAVAFAGEAYLYLVRRVRRIDAGLGRAARLRLPVARHRRGDHALGRGARRRAASWLALGGASIGVVLVLAGGGLGAGRRPRRHRHGDHHRLLLRGLRC
jgi:hypothetical protein